MRLRILGARLLCRNYELPETSEAGLVIPDAYRKVYDGQLYEIVATGTMVREKLGVAAETVTPKGETIVTPALRSDIDIPPLELEVDDIVKMKGLFKGEYSPEMSLYYGYNVWFVNATEKMDGREVCAIQTIWPSRAWKEEAA
jgi:hypothetical protein